MSKSYKKREKEIKLLKEFIDNELTKAFEFDYLFNDRASDGYKLAVKLYDNGYRYLPQADKKHRIKHD